ncbi:hypothetical protein Anas_13962 [Armadillidium nasatum]|uniref:Uncharacterized protein n=1 Tax=Armadillidium nasatum TaxID=96803 RepID=A0A5N5T2R2_9CRUS|nr:hypothetical protein Anas_13962 [Armadillidium nasatum]
MTSLIICHDLLFVVISTNTSTHCAVNPYCVVVLLAQLLIVVVLLNTTTTTNILHLKSSRKRVSRLAEIQLLTSGLYLLPINEENSALKKHRLPEASLRPIFQKEKIRWARHCQYTKRVCNCQIWFLLMSTVLVLQEIVYFVSWGRSTHLVQSGVEFSNQKH